jgi:hypothetical protein
MAALRIYNKHLSVEVKRRVEIWIGNLHLTDQQ